MSDSPDNAASETAGGERLPGVARKAVECRLSGVESGIASPAASGYLAHRRGVFVTLWHSEAGLRGCKGTVGPTRDNLLEETWHNALSAAFEDGRFPPVELEEFEALSFEVSVLGVMEAVDDPAELDPSVYGVVLTARGGRRGLLLPGVRGVETVEEQLAITRRKAGIEPGEAVEVERFRIEKFREMEGNAPSFP